MSACVMAAFFICNFPNMIFYILKGRGILASCRVAKALSFFSSAMFCLTTTVNPIICMTFVQSYRRGLMEILDQSCWSKAGFTTSKLETGEREGIPLQRIRVTPNVRDNLAFSET